MADHASGLRLDRHIAMVAKEQMHPAR